MLLLYSNCLLNNTSPPDKSKFFTVNVPPIVAFPFSSLIILLPGVTPTPLILIDVNSASLPSILLVINF